MPRVSPLRSRWLVGALVLALLATLGARPAPAGAAGSAYVRVNQVGYVVDQTKKAVLMASQAETGATFTVIDASSGQTVLSAPIGGGLGSWSTTFPQTYLMDFSSVATAGSYYLQVSGPVSATSPTFAIDTGPNLMTGLLGNAVFFYQAQRDGPNVISSVMNRQPSHLTDAQASIYRSPRYQNDVLQGGLTKIGGPTDVSGGWFDAGDYIKLVETATYTNAVMLVAVRDHPTLLTGGAADVAGESRFGLDWLQKMWDDTNKILYYQVGIGNGNNGSILGDHDLWRLPQADDALQVAPGDPKYYIKYRPVFPVAAPGAAISPNLAGRLSAALALCFQIYHQTDPTYANQCLLSGENVFDLAKTQGVRQLITADPYDYYPETEWRDDLELGATELYFATALGSLPPGLPHADPSYYLARGAHWARQYLQSESHGYFDSLNLYDVSGLAHAELYRAILQAGNPPGLEITPSQLLHDLKFQLDQGTAQATTDPFGLGIAYGQGDAVPHALGYALEASLYDELAGGTSYRDFELTELNWVFGANAWGASFIVGAGSVFPRCMQHEVANLSGTLDGTPPVVLGATVDGPSALSNFSGLSLLSGMRKCPPAGGDPFAAFTGKGARYEDNVVAWPSVEPSDDYTVLGILELARWVEPPPAVSVGRR